MSPPLPFEEDGCHWLLSNGINALRLTHGLSVSEFWRPWGLSESRVGCPLDGELQQRQWRCWRTSKLAKLLIYASFMWLACSSSTEPWIKMPRRHWVLTTKCRTRTELKLSWALSTDCGIKLERGHLERVSNLPSKEHPPPPVHLDPLSLGAFLPGGTALHGSRCLSEELWGTPPPPN